MKQELFDPQAFVESSYELYMHHHQAAPSFYRSDDG